MSEFTYAKGELINGRYILKKELGKGSCAVVWKAVDIVMRKNIAIKLARYAGSYTRIYDEIRILRKLRNITGVCKLIDPLHSQSPSLAYGFTMELYKYTITECEFSDDIIISVAKQLLTILSEVHAKGFVHTDIKPPNILWKEGSNVILCDFDWAYGISPKYFECYTTSSWYRAPEMVKMRMNGDNVPRSEKIDIWSLGVTLVELVMSQHGNERGNPFDMNKDGKYHYDDKVHLEMIENLDLTELVPHKGISSLLSAMLVTNPRERPSCLELLKHNVFEDSSSSDST